MIAEKQRERVDELLASMEQVVLDADDPAIDQLVTAYRERYALGPRERESERAQTWRGVRCDGRVVAVFGDRVAERVLEITDAYCEETLAGKTAFASMCYGYYAMLGAGSIDRLVYSVLYANTDFWQAVVRDTGDAPHALIFVHERRA